MPLDGHKCQKLQKMYGINVGSVWNCSGKKEFAPELCAPGEIKALGRGLLGRGALFLKRPVPPGPSGPI